MIYLRKTFLFLTGLISIVSCTYTFYPAGCDYPVSGNLRKVQDLPGELQEVSGIDIANGRKYAMNDSGNEPEIYSFGDSLPHMHRTRITNAMNVDWEDIAYDKGFIYIADVGNNFGHRSEFVIYRLQMEDLRSSGDIRIADSILFTYDEQPFNNKNGYSSHDCEAIFIYNDSLYLFAKDWVKKETRVYVMPSKPGNYNVRSRVSYPVKALITGADILPEKKEVVLVGYRNYQPVLIRYSFEDDPSFIQCGGKARIYPMNIGRQVEGVCFDTDGKINVTSEKSIFKQALYQAY